jgi:hypothetical protein
MLMLPLVRTGMWNQGAVTLVAGGVESDVAAIPVDDAALDLLPPKYKVLTAD